MAETIEAPAARLLRMRRELASVTYKLQRATDPLDQRHLTMKRQALSEGVRLLTKPKY